VNIAPGEQGFKIAVVGGGISGLAAAYTIQEASKAKSLNTTVFLIEAENRLGGKILTEQVDGYTIEGGPDCFLSQKPWAAQLAEKIGLKNDLIGTNDEKRKVYVVNKGRLVPLPDGVMLIVPTRIMPFVLSPLISIPGKIRMGLDLLVPPFKGKRDESIGDFVRRRLGKEALEKIAEPLLSGIHVSDPEKQSLMATFPRFRALEQNHGSLIQGMLKERKLAAKKKPASGNGPTSLFLSLRGGLGQIVNQLETCLLDVQLLRGQKVTRLERQAQTGFCISLSGHTPLNVDAVILAIPAYEASGLIGSIAPQIAAELRKIRYVSTATISLAYRKSDIRRTYSGFGFVVPSKEKRDISACTWTSIKFNHRAPEDTILLRCFVGGPGKEEMVFLSDDEMVAVARRELKALMGLDAEPVLTRIYRWEKANPQYDVEHLALVKQIFDQCKEIPGLYLTGSAYEGVGIPDCIRQGQQAAEKVMEFLSETKAETRL